MKNNIIKKFILLIIIQIILFIISFLDIRFFNSPLFYVIVYLTLSGFYFIFKMKNRKIILGIYIPIHLTCLGICFNACGRYTNEISKIENEFYYLSMKNVNKISVIAKPENKNHSYKFNITSKKIIEDFTSNLNSNYVYSYSRYYDCTYEITFYTKDSQYSIEYKKSFNVPQNSEDRLYRVSKNDPRFYKYSIPNRILFDVDYHKKYFFRNNSLIRSITFPDDRIAEDLVIPLSKYIDPLIISGKDSVENKIIEL